MSQEHLLKILLSPHVSEKTTLGSEKNSLYAFEVASFATKPLIKKAVEELFNTSVAKVRVLNTKRKPRKFGGIQGSTKSWKKAYVYLKDGQTISLPGDK